VSEAAEAAVAGEPCSEAFAAWVAGEPDACDDLDIAVQELASSCDVQLGTGARNYHWA
jgi:hypothetical protein